MQKDDVIEFLHRIDQHLSTRLQDLVTAHGFKLKIIGKSALLLAGLVDSAGTVDIDSLGVDGHLPSDSEQRIVDALLEEFGRPRVVVNGYYLEIVTPALVFLPQVPVWIPFPQKFKRLEIDYLEPHHVAASKLFSSFSAGRKKDKDDIVKTLDQNLAEFQKVLHIADEIFDFNSMDSRSDRFSDVYNYITRDLMEKYGEASLKYCPE